MKTLLINPAFSQYGGLQGHGGSVIPLNLCYLAAYVRQQNPDIKIKIIDSEILGLSHEETVSESKNFNPDIIGITANTCVFDSVINLISQLKLKLPNTKIVIGGPHPSALPKQSLIESGAHFTIAGEGEITFNELVTYIKNKNAHWNEIDGLTYYNHNKSIISNKPRELIEDLDILPFPARDLLDNDLYSPPPTKRVGLGPNTLLTTGRGCPFSCGFCGARTVWTQRTRIRKPEYIIKEIEECIDKYNIHNFNLTDEFFTINKQRTLKICNAIIEKKLNISWICSSRAQFLDEEVLKIMKRAGCHEISFGIESGNKEILKKINKSLDLNEAKRVIDLTKKVGITTHASYIIGYIGETENTIKDTIKFSKKLNTHIAAFFIASPLPGTPLYVEAKEKNYLRSDASWINYSPLSNVESVLKLPTISIQEIRKWHRKAIREYYLRPSYILLKILSIRHWYDIVNLFGGLKLFFRIKK
ncbi:hypothetical protein A2331_02665 [Candidatus Falkowbacteria bacterium RIFOXYB2_FULL_34_18]|uniref:Uncharacterized protein n=1 Tax=Candidatus Falkowbacteria bacterium RIFOXYD2_FULL_34_120 TaxID=1798007 RepID=A0A1F5TRR6_9BACT|nr:MAG: hypothetical protein A2331_02665 [Candidatus Falkowbacteria bacterium RIFOXYB2_FULL_34_18]OGF29643.1 MAG: hypothetical protein A2500_00695 [Candidatus Falkowbacteria bacterium RIFOXYC12_FULL_34_55]OGF37370.1 MAG: hypothetical protein A2466_01465 [Candidatus Falkowbacteria bacterium RIFOXYC2_FULL_34_220]OGF39108.1 MAG: hypothetical protein A2515_00115 [Candidatus Falkowbacteria bacterium RIFOXYD12_FULL_34_57]OGF41632.1 MAG: hypothetical protein A2531_06350 [Candidatus Falkowbacteria bact